MRYNQLIQAARQGVHTNAFGKSYKIEHLGTRTFCIEVHDITTPLIEIERGGYDAELDRSHQSRQAIADQQFSPRRLP
jgi:hypothetical protein